MRSLTSFGFASRARRLSRRGVGLFVLVLLATILQTRGAAQDAPRRSELKLPTSIQFNRDIRPILSDKCFSCHGPDSGQRKTAFRFDLEDSAKQTLPGGRFAILPGHPDNSLLVQRITAQDPRRRMPPASTARTLSDYEIALLEEWVRQGAKWEKHWSFEPPIRPEVPTVVNTAWVRNPIDNFVLQRLEQEGLRPSPEAEREPLLRRVTLDLTGKGPTIEEQDAFLADQSPDAYEKVVDRLLASPHYGERMALPWLDAARYSDSSGYQNDLDRSMWRWRDWVIDAFNKNQPYDEFTIEQLAGDLLPNATLDQKIATAFNRNHRTNAEGGVIAAEYAVEYVVDRVATTSSVFLGLTAGCARCHDHKYDPISQKEFYQLFAYFNNIPELGTGARGNSRPYIKAPLPDQQVQLDRFDEQIAAASKRLAALEGSIATAQAAWLQSLDRVFPVHWAPSRGLIAHYPLDGSLDGTVVLPKVRPTRRGRGPGDDGAPPTPDPATVPEERRQEPPAPLTPPQAAWHGTQQYSAGVLQQAASFDGMSLIDAGDIADVGDDYAGDLADKFTLSAWIYPTAGTGAIITKTSERPREKGYLLQLNEGKVQISLASFENLFNAIAVETEQAISLNTWHHVAATYGGTREAPSLTVFVDGQPQSTKTLADFLTFSASVREPLRIGGGGGVENRFRGLIDEVRIYETELTPAEVRILAASKPLNELAAIAPGQRATAEADKIREAFFESAAVPANIRDAVQQLRQLHDERAKYLPGITTVMVMEEMPAPRETRILMRGAYDAPGEIVQPGSPAVLPAIPEKYPRNRLGFARWVVDGSNPLTARVAVNRFWELYFGTGIVKTVDNFGSQGEPPSHPDLLDWLATEFVRSRWNVKALQKLIVTSATYRQASKAMPEELQRDPENRLLARGARFRLSAETIRDQALAASGLLVEKLGGPSVKPYQPEGLWNDLTMGQRYVQDHGESLYRRSLYTFWKRTITPPSMANFDAPTRESSVIHRDLTNSPLQALDLMNNVTYVEAARMLGDRMIKEGGATAQQRLVFAFRLATGRRPNPAELRVLTDALHRAQERFGSQPDIVAVKYLSVGEYPRDQTLNAKELAGFTTVASLILNLDKTITKD